MPQNLRARLERIRSTQGIKNPADIPAPQSEAKNINFSGWEEVGYKTLRRTLTMPFTLPAVLPEALPWLLPDLARYQKNVDPVLPRPDNFLFFDLETTGLSGGAGTVAFLAAFGRFVPGEGKQRGYCNLEVTQFLLLDYPGENDFLEKILELISNFNHPFFLTTYNGKAFDTPLLRTRCLMNGLAFPQLLQLDLLHPARRLWKRIISSCSQGNVETQVLGLDRSGDTPGAMAPDIWFNFLRNEKERECIQALLGICDHNVKDIFGLATMFKAFIEIAESPLDAAARFNCDEENLAMCFRRNEAQKQTATLLLEAAAKSYPRSCLRLGFDYLRQGRFEKGRAALKQLARPPVKWKVPCSLTVQALALRSLAIDAERRLGKKDIAVEYIERAASLLPLPRGLLEDLEKRRERLS